MIRFGILNVGDKIAHISNSMIARINTQGNSDTAMPAYQVSLVGTGKKFTSESIKKIMIRMKRNIILNLPVYTGN